jgi:hypothetical protein
LPAVNYLLSNLDTTGSGNVVLPGNVLVANTTTGVISQEVNATPFGYLYQYINLRYSNNATGTAGFDPNSNNYSYFGVYNSVSSSPSANPSAYQWYEVSPPFDSATSRTLYYSAIGGRQIVWSAASSPPSTSYQVTVANVAIDLDVVTTANGTPGSRGPIAAAFVITTADPNTATAAQLTTWFSASRDNTSPPIGTGLTPVVGDTATFTYTAGVGQPNATFTYNGSIWIPVTGQVITGNVIIPGTLAGNTIIANTITATQIATNTITANNIVGNTITANQIASGTITANNIQTGTLTTNLFTANTINANILQANTFTANTINGNAITANTFAANTINGTAIIANTFAANTINGTSIVSGSITTDKLAANVLTANTVVSTGATIGNFNSQGFWLQGNTGNARFGNTVSIGNALTVGNNAVIGGNLRIGGNLSVTGLVTSGSLNANTVQTTTIVPQAVSVGNSFSTITVQTLAANPINGQWYFSSPNVTITTTQVNESVYVWASLFVNVTGNTTVAPSAVAIGGKLSRFNAGGGGEVEISAQSLQAVATTPGAFTLSDQFVFLGFLDTIATPGSYTYRLAGAASWSGGSTTFTNLQVADRTLLVQSLKR